MSVVRDAFGGKVEADSTKVGRKGLKFPLFHMQVFRNASFVPMNNERVGMTPKLRRRSQ